MLENIVTCSKIQIYNNYKNGFKHFSDFVDTVTIETIKFSVSLEISFFGLLIIQNYIHEVKCYDNLCIHTNGIEKMDKNATTICESGNLGLKSWLTLALSIHSLT